MLRGCPSGRPWQEFEPDGMRTRRVAGETEPSKVERADVSEPGLPVVPASPPDIVSGGDESREPTSLSGPGDPGDTDDSGSKRASSGWITRVAAFAFLITVGLLTSLGMASLLGGAVRRAVLVELETSPVGAEPALSDAPEEAARFFSERDTVRVLVPWDMNVSEFLGLYHLETNPSARAALRDQLGASSDADILREGDEVSLTLTVTRPGG